MANININIPDQTLPKVINAFTKVYEYPPFLKENGITVPNPETKAQFTKRKLIEHIKHITESHEINTAITTTRETTIVTDLSGVN